MATNKIIVSLPRPNCFCGHVATSVYLTPNTRPPPPPALASSSVSGSGSGASAVGTYGSQYGHFSSRRTSHPPLNPKLAPVTLTSNWVYECHFTPAQRGMVAPDHCHGCAHDQIEAEERRLGREDESEAELASIAEVIRSWSEDPWLKSPSTGQAVDTTPVGTLADYYNPLNIHQVVAYRTSSSHMKSSGLPKSWHQRESWVVPQSRDHREEAGCESITYATSSTAAARLKTKPAERDSSHDPMSMLSPLAASSAATTSDANNVEAWDAALISAVGRNSQSTAQAPNPKSDANSKTSLDPSFFATATQLTENISHTEGGSAKLLFRSSATLTTVTGEAGTVAPGTTDFGAHSANVSSSTCLESTAPVSTSYCLPADAQPNPRPRRCKPPRLSPDSDSQSRHGRSWTENVQVCGFHMHALEWHRMQDKSVRLQDVITLTERANCPVFSYSVTRWLFSREQPEEAGSMESHGDDGPPSAAGEQIGQYALAESLTNDLRKKKPFNTVLCDCGKPMVVAPPMLSQIDMWEADGHYALVCSKAFPALTLLHEGVKYTSSRADRNRRKSRGRGGGGSKTALGQEIHLRIESEDGPSPAEEEGGGVSESLLRNDEPCRKVVPMAALIYTPRKKPVHRTPIPNDEWLNQIFNASSAVESFFKEGQPPISPRGRKAAGNRKYVWPSMARSAKTDITKRPRSILVSENHFTYYPRKPPKSKRVSFKNGPAEIIPSPLFSRTISPIPSAAARASWSMDRWDDGQQGQNEYELNHGNAGIGREHTNEWPAPDWCDDTLAYSILLNSPRSSETTQFDAGFFSSRRPMSANPGSSSSSSVSQQPAATTTSQAELSYDPWSDANIQALTNCSSSSVYEVPDNLMYFAIDCAVDDAEEYFLRHAAKIEKRRIMESIRMKHVQAELERQQDRHACLVQEIEELEGNRMQMMQHIRCRVCFERLSTHAVLPCWHLVMCGQCADQVKECIVCRGPKTGTQRIYWGNGKPGSRARAESRQAAL